MSLDEKRPALERLCEFLEGEDWCITGGLAVNVHAAPSRTVGDIDLLMRRDGARRLADRLGLELETKEPHGEGFTGVEEVRLAFELEGEEVEVMAGDTALRIDGEAFHAEMDDRLFEHAVSVEVAGVVVPVVAPAEVLIQRVVLGREKDVEDIAMLLRNTEIDEDVLADSLDARSLSRERFEQLLTDHGFSL